MNVASALMAGVLTVGGLDASDAEAKPNARVEHFQSTPGLGSIDTGGAYGTKVLNMPPMHIHGNLDMPSTSGRAFPYMGHVERRGMHKAAEGKDENGLMEFVEKVVQFVKENAAIVLEKAKAGR